MGYWIIDHSTKTHRWTNYPGGPLGKTEYMVPADEDGFVEWDGGECPLPDDQPCRVKYRSCGDLPSGAEIAGNLQWGHIDRPGDIVAYQPVPKLLLRGNTADTVIMDEHHTVTTRKPLKGQKWVITQMNKGDREKWQRRVERLGAEVVASVSPDVKYVLHGHGVEGNSAKLVKARRLDCHVVNPHVASMIVAEVESLLDLGMFETNVNVSAEHHTSGIEQALNDPDHPYHDLADVLEQAFQQAAGGKGKERHANDLPFSEQRMQSIARGQGHIGGMIYQVCKKSQEAERLERDAALRELLGAIVYAGGAFIYLKGDNDA